ncbi:unnamed protein product [Paramecium octaurelia]|uniref:Uncharacterized protein n=1 Tax=Paramecium octaurelia TaxID=43137 RepID=A0A8S1VL17_PAROT|nr:unnamed protein product [Paramecium octaurelia]
MIQLYNLRNDNRHLVVLDLRNSNKLGQLSMRGSLYTSMKSQVLQIDLIQQTIWKEQLLLMMIFKFYYNKSNKLIIQYKTISLKISRFFTYKKQLKNFIIIFFFCIQSLKSIKYLRYLITFSSRDNQQKTKYFWATVRIPILKVNLKRKLNDKYKKCSVNYNCISIVSDVMVLGCSFNNKRYGYWIFNEYQKFACSSCFVNSIQLRGNTIVDKNFYSQLLLQSSQVLNNKRIQVKK